MDLAATVFSFHYFTNKTNNARYIPGVSAKTGYYCAPIIADRGEPAQKSNSFLYARLVKTLLVQSLIDVTVNDLSKTAIR